MILDIPYSKNAIFLTTLFLYVYYLFFSLIHRLFVGCAVVDNVVRIYIGSFVSRMSKSICAIGLVSRLGGVGGGGLGWIGDGRFCWTVFGGDVGFVCI